MYLVDFLNLDESFSWNTNIAPDRNTPLHAYSHPNGRIGVVGKGQNNAYIAQSFTFSADSDGDGIPDLFDTHIYVPSSSDWDNDGLLNSIDNCPYVWNLDQANSDNDLYGDACDTDIDGDDITNTIPIDLTSASNIDKCPYVFANSSKDKDGDGCEDDADADGVIDVNDICPGNPDSDDADGDGVPDGCDEYPDDTDNDGVINSFDNCITTFNPSQQDSGGEPTGDACDYDIDGDGVNNSIPVDLNATDNFDRCPYSYSSPNNDSDRDGCDDEPVTEQCDVCDIDDGEVKGEEKTNDTIIDPSLSLIHI